MPPPVGQRIPECINVLEVAPTPSSAELEEPFNADEGAGATDSPHCEISPKR